MATQTKEQKLALINENLEEVLNPEIIEKVLDEGRNVKVYWGRFLRRATCGSSHQTLKVPPRPAGRTVDTWSRRSRSRSSWPRAAR